MYYKRWPTSSQKSFHCSPCCTVPKKSIRAGAATPLLLPVCLNLPPSCGVRRSWKRAWIRFHSPVYIFLFLYIVSVVKCHVFPVSNICQKVSCSQAVLCTPTHAVRLLGSCLAAFLPWQMLCLCFHHNIRCSYSLFKPTLGIMSCWPLWRLLAFVINPFHTVTQYLVSSSAVCFKRYVDICLWLW